MLRTEALAAPAAVTAAFAATTRAAVGIIIELNRQIADLEAELATHFEAHPDADIYRSLPGLGVVLGARVLGEFGDDPDRYTSAKSRKNYAGTSPLTVASGKKRAVLARHVRNRRLYDAIDQWALCALTTSPGARACYDHHRAAGDVHHQALRGRREVRERQTRRTPRRHHRYRGGRIKDLDPQVSTIARAPARPHCLLVVDAPKDRCSDVNQRSAKSSLERRQRSPIWRRRTLGMRQSRYEGHDCGFDSR